MRLFGTAWVVKDGAIIGRMVVSDGGWKDDSAAAHGEFKQHLEQKWREAAAATDAVLEWGPIGRSWAEQRGTA